MREEPQEEEERNCHNESSLLRRLAGVRPVEQRVTNISQSRGGCDGKITPASLRHLLKVSLLLEFHFAAAAAA